ncbi:hypothetical protein Tco_0882716 [Tanacetum coccineum]
MDDNDEETDTNPDKYVSILLMEPTFEKKKTPTPSTTRSNRTESSSDDETMPGDSPPGVMGRGVIDPTDGALRSRKYEEELMTSNNVTFIASFIPLIMEYLVKISKKARILELKRRHLKITVLTSNTPYPSRKIQHICACTSLKTTKDQGSIRCIQRSLYAFILYFNRAFDATYQFNLNSIDKTWTSVTPDDLSAKAFDAIHSVDQ